MTTGRYFDIEQENELIASGSHFWCTGCLYARPLDDQSPDPRYCQSCFDILTAEAKLLPPKARSPSWVPKIQGEKGADVPQHPTQIMHTTNGDKIPSVHNSSRGPVSTRGKRGPKHKLLPIELISQWAGEGIRSKAITSRLKRELDIKVHYSTIQRILSGQRVMR